MNSEHDERQSDRTGRRRVLYAAGVAITSAVAGCSGGDGGDSATNDTDVGNETSNETDTGNQTGNETDAGNETGTESEVITGEIRLGGETAGWTGMAPASIEGTTNPTLRLEADTEYTLVWENLDGAEHELVIADDAGEDLVKSDDAGGEGQTVSTTFTATSEMAEYFCEYHPESMRGELQVE